MRSYGTEDRKCAKPVAARDDVYEYIIFKAADIKELVVTDTPKVVKMEKVAGKCLSSKKKTKLTNKAAQLTRNLVFFLFL